MARRSGAAFSLVELLVVIGILTLLLTIAVPSLNHAKGLARRSVCATNLRRLATAVQAYSTRYDSALFPDRLAYDLAGNDFQLKGEYPRKAPRWQWMIAESDEPPIEKRALTDAQWDAELEMTSERFLCPSLDGEGARSIRDGAYGYNHMYFGCGNPVSSSAHRPVLWPVRIDRVFSTSDTLIVADSRGAVDGPQMNVRQHSYTLDPPRLAAGNHITVFGPEEDYYISGDNDAIDTAAIPDAYRNSPVDDRHYGRGNVAFLDAHVEPMTLGVPDGESLPGRSLGYILDDGVVIKGHADGSNALWTGTEDAAP
jgi:prepilin-type processing-associated H-X9-DG protein